MSDEEEPTYGLVMPFVTVLSNGGTYDDAAYVAGYEMGRIETTLNVAHTLGATPTPLYVHTENAPQADLIAMRYGFLCASEEVSDGWTKVTFTRGTDESDED